MVPLRTNWPWQMKGVNDVTSSGILGLAPIMAIHSARVNEAPDHSPWGLGSGASAISQ